MIDRLSPFGTTMIRLTYEAEATYLIIKSQGSSQLSFLQPL